MSATAAVTATATRTATAAPLGRVLRFESVKLAAQWRVRLLLLACWFGPGVLVAVVGHQTSLPADTVFGRLMGQTGWAGSLVVLTFCATWVLPLATSLVAGDAFAVEDRLGTWRHVLVAVRSARRIFVAKALASLGVVLVLVVGLAVSSVVGGLLTVGNRPLVGLDGHLLSSGDAATAVLLAWLLALAPTLAFAAVGLLGSVVLGRSPTGLLVPAVLAVVLQLVQVLPLPVAVRMALPSWGFLAWRGLFVDPTPVGPIVAALAVDLAWAVAATALAYVLFTRRDFTDLAYDGTGRRVALGSVLPLAAVTVVSVALIAVVAPAGSSGIDAPKLNSSLATAFGHLYRLQSRQLHRPDVDEATLATTAACDKGGSLVEDHGAGNDWRCVVTWHLPDATATGQAVYQLDVTADGRYQADGDGPVAVNGFFQVRTPTGDAPNPLWQFDGSVDLLAPTHQE